MDKICFSVKNTLSCHLQPRSIRTNSSAGSKGLASMTNRQRCSQRQCLNHKRPRMSPLKAICANSNCVSTPDLKKKGAEGSAKKGLSEKTKLKKKHKIKKGKGGKKKKFKKRKKKKKSKKG